MFGIDDALLGAGVSALGNIAGGLFGGASSAKAAGRQMDFQERMSNTAYQRAMVDMRAAGLNPMLSAKLGGASSPAGAMSTVPDLSSIGTSSVNSALAATRNTAEVDKIRADTDLSRENAKNVATDTLNKERELGWTPERTEGLRLGNAQVAQTISNLQIDHVLKEEEWRLLVSKNVSAAAEARRDEIVLKYLNSREGAWLSEMGYKADQASKLFSAGGAGILALEAAKELYARGGSGKALAKQVLDAVTPRMTFSSDGPPGSKGRSNPVGSGFDYVAP
ncbi:MAG: DNA pilot protein [Microvirus sp.]|nr:MAG: DNA pilot protein [Microvirus sp.]